jgi:protein dithiol oxidoreductase (disulfide-forming)
MSNRMIGRLSLLGALLFLASSNLLGQGTAASKYQEGIHYTLIENAPAVPAGKVSVVEAFSYMCPHCATFEPYISNWMERKPENVEFRRIPVVFGRGSWELYARAYVTAEVMGIANEAHGGLMDKIWKDKKVMRTMDDLAAFYSAYGVEAGVFMATSQSFAVDAKMRKDQRAAQDAGVQGTPSLIINSKYLVAGNEAVANYDVMLDVVDYLVTLETAKTPATTSTQTGQSKPTGDAAEPPAGEQ